MTLNGGFLLLLDLDARLQKLGLGDGSGNFIGETRRLLQGSEVVDRALESKSKGEGNGREQSDAFDSKEGSGGGGELENAK